MLNEEFQKSLWKQELSLINPMVSDSCPGMFKDRKGNPLKPGDHIKVKIFWSGGIIKHHGIYCGSGEVIHFYSEKSGPLAKLYLRIEETPLDRFAKGKPIDVVDYSYPNPLSHKVSWPSTVIDRALKIKNGLYVWEHLEILKDIQPKKYYSLSQKYTYRNLAQYHLFKWNCEHLATWCKTGVAHSKQTQFIVDTLIELEVSHYYVEKAQETTWKIATSGTTRTLAFVGFRAALRSIIKASTGF